MTDIVVPGSTHPGLAAHVAHVAPMPHRCETETPCAS